MPAKSSKAHRPLPRAANGRFARRAGPAAPAPAQACGADGFGLAAERILFAALMTGGGLARACQTIGAPGRAAVLDRADADPAFAARLARARELGAEMMAEDLAERVLSVADAVTNASAAADKVKIAAYQWLAARLSPKGVAAEVASLAAPAAELSDEALSAIVLAAAAAVSREA